MTDHIDTAEIRAMHIVTPMLPQGVHALCAEIDQLRQDYRDAHNDAVINAETAGRAEAERDAALAERGPLTDWQREFLARAANAGLAGSATTAGFGGGGTAGGYVVNLERRVAIAESKSRVLAKAVAIGARDGAELADANALLLDLAGQLWDAEKEIDRLTYSRDRFDRWLTAAQKVLYDTHPYPGSQSNRTWHWDRLATKITERIEWFKAEMAKADLRLQDAYDDHNVDRNQFADDLARLTADRDKWKRIAAELAADHLGEQA